MLICNTFPPAAGIGGRRWAKFSKYLTPKGYEIHVACPEDLSGQVSQWYLDVSGNSSIKVYPQQFAGRRLLLTANNHFSRMLRKLLVIFLRFTPHSERFITSLPNPGVWNNIAGIIKKEQIQTVIVSGDPFLAYYAAKLKDTFPCRLILDYRDLWSDHSFYQKHFKLTTAQWNFFREAEDYALKNCDDVIVVDEHLKRVISKRMPAGQESKISVIHNGFDPDDFQGVTQQHKTNTVKLYFSGNIASDLNEITLRFAECFFQLKEKKPELYNSLQIHIKGKMDESLYEKLSSFKLANLVVKNEFVPLNDYYREVAGSDLGIIILSEEYANSFTTKCIDYIYLNKKILVLGQPGKISEFLQQEGNGDVFTMADDSSFFEKLIPLASGPANYSADTKIQFNIEDLTDRLTALLGNKTECF